MARRKFGLLLVAAFVTCIKGQKCQRRRGIEVGGCQIEENGETMVITADNRTDCEKYDECCWNRKECLNKDRGKGGDPVKVDEDPFDTPKVPARFLTLPPPQLCPPKKPDFPYNCEFRKNQPYVTVPPVDVPYCVRIPCSLDRAEQKNLDRNHFLCGSQPGCYFDVELFEYREAFGPAVLAGIPVCHLAIRDDCFHTHAGKFIAAYGSWNPYGTYCILETFKIEFDPRLLTIKKYYVPRVLIKRPGCLLSFFSIICKIYLKLAGWIGITSQQCILIGACWVPNRGCFYPVDVDNVVVKSNQRFKFNKFEVTYGRPKCQHWNDDNPWELMKSYHRCLAAGCSVDVSIASLYYNNLFEIGKHMSVKDHWEYWTQVEAGKIGPSDMEEGIYWEFDRTFGEGPKTPRPTPTPDGGWPLPGPFTPPPPGPFTPPPPGPFTPPPPGPFTPPLPGPFVPRPDERTRCGMQWQQYGYRPCPPPSPPKYVQSDWCPYKPFIVPRFKPLKGSFRGCCDINPCYISRRDIRKMHSGPSYYYTEWSLFSLCSTTCGDGIQKRVRRCISQDKSLCTEKTEEVRSCNEKPCGNWGRWGPWEPRPCAFRNMLQTRKRVCVPRGATCGVNQETEEEENRYC